FGLARQWVDWFRNGVGSAMVSDVGDPAVSLMMNGRLICRATLQIVETNKAHIGSFRGIADLRGFRGGGTANEQCDYGNRKSVRDISFNFASPCKRHRCLQSIKPI